MPKPKGLALKVEEKEEDKPSATLAYSGDSFTGAGIKVEAKGASMGMAGSRARSRDRMHLAFCATPPCTATRAAPAGVTLADGTTMAGAVLFDDIEVVKKLGAGCSRFVVASPPPTARGLPATSTPPARALLTPAASCSLCGTRSPATSTR